MTMSYEREVSAALGEASYRICLDDCDQGKVKVDDIIELASCLDSRIKGPLLRELERSPHQSTRNLFRFIMSEWFNYGHDRPSLYESPICVDDLINALKSSNVKLFAFADPFTS